MENEQKKQFASASARDRFQINLTDKQKKDLVWWLKSKFNSYKSQRSVWEQNQLKLLQYTDDFMSPIDMDKRPYGGGFDFKAPVIPMMCKEYSSMLYNIFSNRSLYTTVPNGTSEKDEKFAAFFKTAVVKELFDNCNNKKGIIPLLESLFVKVANEGFAIVWKEWVHEQEKFIDIEEDPELETFVEVQKIRTKYEGTMFRLVPWANIVFPANLEDPSDLDEPDCVTIIDSISRSQLKLKSMQKLYDSEAVNRILQRKTNSVDSGENVTFKQTKDNKVGTTSSPHSEYNDEIKRRIAFCRYDIDEDGIDEELVVHYEEQTGEILFINYLCKINPTGKRGLYKFDCFVRDGNALSRGVAETIWYQQLEAESLKNMRLAYLALQTAPFGFIRSNGYKDKPIEILPGRMIPVQDTSDVRIITLTTSASALIGEEAATIEYARLMLNVSATSQGFVGDTVGALRSTSGVNALSQKLEQAKRPVVVHNSYSMIKLINGLVEDIDYRMSPHKKIVYAEQSGLSIDDLKNNAGPTDYLKVSAYASITAEAAALMVTEEIKKSDAYQILQICSTPSLLHQFKIITPSNLYNAYKNWLNTFQLINTDDYCTKPEGYTNTPLTLIQEVIMIKSGMMPPMSMSDDHAKKAAELQAFIESDVFNQGVEVGDIPSNSIDLFTKAIQTHEQLAAQLSPKGLPNIYGAQNQDTTQLMSGRAPQQGGYNERQTTGRDSSAANQPSETIEEQPRME